MIRLEMGKPTMSRITYEDAQFYIFCLSDGWRMPTINECIIYQMYGDWWYAERRRYSVDDVYLLQPVREVPGDD